MALQERKKQAESDPLLIKTEAFSRQSLCQSLCQLSLPLYSYPRNRFLSREFVEWQWTYRKKKEKRTRRIHFNNKIMNNALMISYLMDNSNFQSDKRGWKGWKSWIKTSSPRSGDRRSCFNGDEMNLLENIERFCWPIRENWPYSSSYREYSSNQRCENAPFHLWLTTATILVYRILIIE